MTEIIPIPALSDNDIRQPRAGSEAVCAILQTAATTQTLRKPSIRPS